MDEQPNDLEAGQSVLAILVLFACLIVFVLVLHHIGAI